MPTLDDLIGYTPPSDIAVTSDPVSRVYMPASVAEWQLLLSGTSFNAPSSFWVASQASGTTLADLGTGARTVTIAGSPTLGAAATGWQSTGIQCTDGSTTQYGAFTSADVNTTSQLLLTCWGVNTNPAASRRLNNLGGSTDEGATLLPGNSGPKVGSISGANTASGEASYSSILVVVTKLDRSTSEMATFTRGEKVSATWTAPGASTSSTLFGHPDGSSDATFLYGAYWTGSDAELSDAGVQQLIDFVYGDSTTLSAMQAGSLSVRFVVAIEGCEYLLTEDCEEAALRAFGGSDWTEALGGLRVELKNSQTLEILSAFTGGGSCTLRVTPDPDDTFGILVNRRAAGSETELTATIDRNDTTVNVASTQDFPSSGTVYVGTEAIGYTGTTSTSFTGCTRGKWSPAGCAVSGSGGSRFANHHRVGQDPYHVQMRPLVTSLPRVWVGKRVVVLLHTYDALTGTLNSRDEAQAVFVGRIANIADDPNTGETVLDLEPIHEEIRNAVIGKDIWAATLADGIDIVAGRKFSFVDHKQGQALSPANDLEVVASGATGTNQINAGRYSLSEVCEFLSKWLAGEKAAARINGTYTWMSPVSSNVGQRTKCYWRIEDADSSLWANWSITMPGEVFAFLGMTETEPGDTGTNETRFSKTLAVNKDHIEQGAACPFVNLVFRPTGPGLLAQEFSEIMTYAVTDERGTFVDQRALLPASIKAATTDDLTYGIFLLGEEILMVGAYDSSTLTKCWLAPVDLATGKEQAANRYWGRRADEPESGPVTLRQILWLEGNVSNIAAALIYGTGTPGYNHADHDQLGYGLGMGIPGQHLGGSFERSLSNLPKGDAPISVIIDEPKKFSEIIGQDLLIRRTFLRWKDESFEFAQWRTPNTHNAVAALTESNKAAPSGHVENHRISTLETSEAARPIIKIDYGRDYSLGKDGQFLKSIQIEDQTAVDDAGGNVKPFTIRLANCYHDRQGAGAAVESLIPDFIAMMPVLARPVRKISRSIDLRYFETLSVGDVVTVTDTFARDPLTGRRGVSGRAAIVSRISYDIGGSNADGSTRPMGGEVELMFLDVHRGEMYAPAAQVDDTATNAGYNAGTKTLRCYPHKYSHALSITVNWGTATRTFHIEETADAQRFVATDKVRVVEIDPANPASPLAWDDTVASQSGDDIVLTTGLASWDNAKKYRVTYQPFSACTTAQQDYSFQADSTDMMVEDLEVAYHFSSTPEDTNFVENDGTEKGEYIVQESYGDGKPYDVGHERALINTLNAWHDGKSLHQSPWLVNSAAANSAPVYVRPIFFGTEHALTAVRRPLTVAPLFRSTTGSPVTVTVTLSRDFPSQSTDSAWGSNSISPRFVGAFSQATFTTSSTTFVTGDDQIIGLSVKDLELGYAFLTIETSSTDCECYGLAKCIEGSRVARNLSGLDLNAAF